LWREQENRFERRHRLKADGYDLGVIMARGTELHDMTAAEILTQASKKRHRV